MYLAASWQAFCCACSEITSLLLCCCRRCTWDAFYSTVSARGLVEGLGSLAAGGLSPQLLIIDDGWQVRGRLLHDWRCVHFIRAFFHIYAASADHRQLAGESAPAALFLLSSYVCSFVRCVVPVYDNHVCYVCLRAACPTWLMRCFLRCCFCCSCCCCS